jgi:hypothetical protein
MFHAHQQGPRKRPLQPLQKPLKDKVIEWGQHKGLRWSEVDEEYLRFIIALKKQAPIEIDALEDELARRELVNEAELPMAEQIVKAGYWVLALKYHPDAGGTDKQMRELNASCEGLKVLLKQQMS